MREPTLGIGARATLDEDDAPDALVVGIGDVEVGLTVQFDTIRPIEKRFRRVSARAVLHADRVNLTMPIPAEACRS
jgi:hypothetical protein